MSVRRHGRRVAVAGQPRRKFYRRKPLKAKDVKGWQPSGWSAEQVEPCVKIKYDDKETAEFYGRKAIRMRAYRCPDCRSWHLSSKGVEVAA